MLRKFMCIVTHNSGKREHYTLRHYNNLLTYLQDRAEFCTDIFMGRNSKFIIALIMLFIWVKRIRKDAKNLKTILRKKNFP